MINILAKFISSGFGLGYSKKAPGTVGSVGLFLVYYPVIPADLITKIIFALAISIIGSIAVKIAVGEQDDPQWVVVDEFAGLAFALILSDTIALWVISLLLFRFFDITKILGIRKVEEIKNPYGIMLDDILAGIYSLTIIYIIKCVY